MPATAICLYMVVADFYKATRPHLYSARVGLFTIAV